MKNSQSLLQKSIVCCLAGIIGAYAFFEVCRKILAPWINVISGISLAIFLGAAMSVLVWHYRERRLQIKSSSVLVFWQNAICYFIAIDLCMFSWRKIFHLQFYAPYGLLDKPVSSLTGQQLTIAYFSYSYPFALCIAGLQMIGAVFLLFKRTRLLGIFILIPVVSNIILLDFFYEIEAGAMIMAVMLLSGLIYLLLCDYKKIRAFFFGVNERTDASFKRNILKNTVRISTVVIPLGICILLYDQPNRHSDITGKFTVRRIIVNRNKQELNDCKSSVLSLVYIDDNNDLVFERNSPGKWQVGHFNYNKERRTMRVIWRYPTNFHDTLWASLSGLVKNEMTLSGIMGADTLTVELLKLK